METVISGFFGKVIIPYFNVALQPHPILLFLIRDITTITKSDQCVDSQAEMKENKILGENFETEVLSLKLNSSKPQNVRLK